MKNEINSSGGTSPAGGSANGKMQRKNPNVAPIGRQKSNHPLPAAQSHQSAVPKAQRGNNPAGPGHGHAGAAPGRHSVTDRRQEHAGSASPAHGVTTPPSSNAIHTNHGGNAPMQLHAGAPGGTSPPHVTAGKPDPASARNNAEGPNAVHGIHNRDNADRQNNSGANGAGAARHRKNAAPPSAGAHKNTGASTLGQRPRRQNEKSQNVYAAHKLVGALAIAAALLVAVTFMLFAGNAASGVPIFSGAKPNSDTHIKQPPSGAGAAGNNTGKNTDGDKLALKNRGKAYVVCIDPGHGYDDPGAVYPDTIGELAEKDLTLAVSLLLKDKLEEAGLTVILTRSGDETPDDGGESGPYTFDPFERVDFVLAHSEIDLFISLHCDAFTEDTSVGGTRVYIYENAGSATEVYARSLADAIGEQLSADVQIIAKDIYEAYYVTKKLPVPSVLVEMGFITNPADAANLLSDDWRAAFVDGTKAGIVAYLNSLD